MALLNVSKIGYVGFETPDVDRMVEHYTKVLDFVLVERNADQAFLTTNFEHHAVVIERAAAARARSYVGYELREDLDYAGEQLRGAGYAVDRRHDLAPSTPDVVVVREPGSEVPIHLYDGQSGSGVAGYTPLRPTKLGHVAAFTPDLVRLQGFYQDLLGFRWSDTVGDFFVFLRCNADHHAANFLASTKRAGMHHVAFEARDLNHLQTQLDHLAAHGVRLNWGPGRHGPGHNIFTYHLDPDGNTVELFTQLDVMSTEDNGYFEPRPWHEDFPQVPKTWEADLATINSWGPVEPAQLDH
ncbi:VOC family protein [Amycolatopsis jejuensis]|uniref:VOC family protein n=1 Tax=Amycolatopsis jejuensis TaxID=330084 RepID=UPI0006892DA2|nr:VOC family protein [Amycolatopsis jejuensis]